APAGSRAGTASRAVPSRSPPSPAQPEPTRRVALPATASPSPPDPIMQLLTRAHASLADGDGSATRALLRDLLAKHPPRPQRAEAEPLTADTPPAGNDRAAALPG